MFDSDASILEKKSIAIHEGKMFVRLWRNYLFFLKFSVFTSIV